MRRLGWHLGYVSLGLLACGCGGRVVGMIGPDAGSSAPQRGPVDASVIVVDSGAPPPPPPMDAPSARDVPMDRITVVDTGAPDLIVGTPCTIVNGNNNCADGFYCQSANCMTGVCVAAPASTEREPGVRLRSPDLLEHVDRGGQRRFRPRDRHLREQHRLQRQQPQHLSHARRSATWRRPPPGCNLVNPGGRCWVLPDTCPPLPAGTTATTRRCNSNNACVSRCTLIMNGRTFFEDPTCP